MKLSCREDVNAPVADVFARLADFDVWERAALRRGAEVQRLGGAGGETAWDLGFVYRGKPRRLRLTLAKLAAPEKLAFAGRGASLEGTLAITLLEMAPRRTRMLMTLEVTPRTLMARLFLQSLRLGRRRIDARFRDQVRRLAADIEDRVARAV